MTIGEGFPEKNHCGPPLQNSVSRAAAAFLFHTGNTALQLLWRVCEDKARGRYNPYYLANTVIYTMEPIHVQSPDLHPSRVVIPLRTTYGRPKISHTQLAKMAVQNWISQPTFSRFSTK